MAIRRCEMKKAIEMRVNALCLIGAVAVLGYRCRQEPHRLRRIAKQP